MIESAPISARFTEIAQQAGIDFMHVNGARGRKLMPETVGSGMAFLTTTMTENLICLS
jgi:hypothetical protein